MATAKTATKKTPASLETVFRYVLVITSAVGLLASFILSYDKLRVLENPSFNPNCNLNPVLSCSSVMASHQSNALGFPNPWMGLISFGCLLTVGAALFAGARFKRWFWLAMYAGIILGLAFALWLLFESIYSINALCPYCLATDVAVITMFWYSTLYLIEQKHIALKGKLLSAAGFSRRHHLDVLLLTFVAIILVILNHFWYYYGKFF